MHYTPNCAAQQVELNHPKFGQPLQATNEAASRCSLGSFSLLSGYGNMAAVAAASQHPALGSVSRGPPSPLSLSFDTHVPVQNRLPRLSLSLDRAFSRRTHTHARTHARARSLSSSLSLCLFLPRSRISFAASLSLSLSLSLSFSLRPLTWPPYDASPFRIFLLSSLLPSPTRVSPLRPTSCSLSSPLPVAFSRPYSHSSLAWKRIQAIGTPPGTKEWWRAEREKEREGLRPDIPSSPFLFNRLSFSLLVSLLSADHLSLLRDPCRLRGRRSSGRETRTRAANGWREEGEEEGTG